MTAEVSKGSFLSQQPLKDVWNGEVYAKNATLQQQLGLQVIHSYDDLDRSPKNILDVGCGDGFLTRYIANYFSESTAVVGIDSSESMIEKATSSHEDTKIKIVKYDITDPGITSLGLFDTIFSFNALHWVKDQKAALNNIYKLLSFGGIFRAQLFPPLACQSILMDNIAKLMEIEKWRNYLKDFKLPVQMQISNIREYKILLEETGFTIHKCTEIEHSFTKTRDEVASGFKSWLPHLRMIPEKDQDEFLEALTNLIFDACGARDRGEAEMKFSNWKVYTSKN